MVFVGTSPSRKVNKISSPRPDLTISSRAPQILAWSTNFSSGWDPLQGSLKTRCCGRSSRAKKVASGFGLKTSYWTTLYALKSCKDLVFPIGSDWLLVDMAVFRIGNEVLPSCEGIGWMQRQVQFRGSSAFWAPGSGHQSWSPSFAHPWQERRAWSFEWPNGPSHPPALAVRVIRGLVDTSASWRGNTRSLCLPSQPSTLPQTGSLLLNSRRTIVWFAVDGA